MRIPHLRLMRVIAVLIVVFLSLQFELGMTINLSPEQHNLPAFGLSIPLIIQALDTVGGIGPLHASVGIVLLLLAITNLVLALSSRTKGVQIVGTLGLFSTSGALATGILFTLSGFQNDGYSHGMATNFLLTFVFAFVGLYLLCEKKTADTA